MTNQVVSVGQVAVLIDGASKKEGKQPPDMLFRKKLPSGKVIGTHSSALGKIWLGEAMDAGQGRSEAGVT